MSPIRARLAFEAGLLVALTLTLTTWFAEWPAGLGPGWPAGSTVVLAGLIGFRRRQPLPRPAPETLLCLGLALAYRLPVLIYPWGWVNKDGFYSGMVTLHVLQGARPAPAFLEGLNYQGTLKAHLAALVSLVTGSHDLAFLLAAAAALLSLLLVFVAMSLARRVAGRSAALVTGLYLALGPKFLTTLSMNCQGHYIDILALGGAALAILARLLDLGLSGSAARSHYLGLGLAMGAAFWQQPVALSYLATVFLVLAARRVTWRDPWVLVVLLGLAIGLAPAIIWNVLHDWGTGEIMGRNTVSAAEMLRGLPRHVSRTVGLSFPILAGLSPGHPWGDAPGLRRVVAALPILLLVGYLCIARRDIASSLRNLRPSPAVLAPLLSLACLGIFWAVPGNLIHLRPRYLLPLTAALAIHLGVVAAWTWRRSRSLASAGTALVLALNVWGMVPRLVAGKGVSDYYHELVQSVEQKGIETGYGDFSVAAPITLFTAERIVISPRLGPTPNYESAIHARIVDTQGADAYLLEPRDDRRGFAAALDQLGVDYRVDLEPVPVFYDFSRPVAFEEVVGFRSRK